MCWWFGMVWTGRSSIFPKHPFRQVAVILFILFFKSSWWKIASAARNLINSVPQTAATTVYSIVLLSRHTCFYDMPIGPRCWTCSPRTCVSWTCPSTAWRGSGRMPSCPSSPSQSSTFRKGSREMKNQRLWFRNFEPSLWQYKQGCGWRIQNRLDPYFFVCRIHKNREPGSKSYRCDLVFSQR